MAVRLRHVWYRIDGVGQRHLYDGSTQATACGVSVQPHRIGRSGAPKALEACGFCLELMVDE
jgi:hypothetical protein